MHCTHLDEGDAFLVQQRRRDKHILVAQEGLQQQPILMAGTALWEILLQEDVTLQIWGGGPAGQAAPDLTDTS